MSSENSHKGYREVMDWTNQEWCGEEYNSENFEEEKLPDPSQKYILFVIQEANFCSRVLLAPYEEFLKVRGEEYNILKEHSQKNVKIVNHAGTADEEEIIVSNLLVQNIIWERNENGRRTCGTHEKYPWSEAFHVAHFYANFRDYNIGKHYAYLSMEDQEWTPKMLHPISSNFNNLTTYQQYIHNPKYNIIDSFLILEADDGEIREVQCQDVEEMYLKYFSEKMNST